MLSSGVLNTILRDDDDDDDDDDDGKRLVMVFFFSFLLLALLSSSPFVVLAKRAAPKREKSIVFVVIGREREREKAARRSLDTLSRCNNRESVWLEESLKRVKFNVPSHRISPMSYASIYRYCAF